MGPLLDRGELRKEQMNKTERIQIRMTLDEREAVERAARADRRSMSSWIGKAIRVQLERERAIWDTLKEKL